MSNFFITGLPRSRTAWFSTFFTGNNSFCYHEIIRVSDGFDDAIVGYCYDTVTSEDRVIYSFSKCVDILKRDMSEGEAIEYMDFNVVGSHMGNKTPLFMRDYAELEE